MYLAKIDILTSRLTGTGIKNFEYAGGFSSVVEGTPDGSNLLKTLLSSLLTLAKFTATTGSVMF